MPKNDLASLRFVQAEAFAAVAGVPFCSRPEQDAGEDGDSVDLIDGKEESNRKFETAHQVLPYTLVSGIAFCGGLLWLARIFI